MNKKPIEQAKNPLLQLALPALERAARRAWNVAAQTGTAIVFTQDGKLQRIYPDQVRDTDASYQDANDQ